MRLQSLCFILPFDAGEGYACIGRIMDSKNEVCGKEAHNGF